MTEIKSRLSSPERKSRHKLRQPNRIAKPHDFEIALESVLEYVLELEVLSVM